MVKLSPYIRKSGDHLMFWCTGCEHAHVIDVANRGWKWNGDITKPTITPSVREYWPAHDGIPEETQCHLFVTAGKVKYLSDCKHKLAGQTVDLEPIPDDYGGCED